MKNIKRVVSFMLMVAMAFCLFPVNASAAANAKYTVSVTKDYDNAYALLNLVNKERVANGVPALTMDKELTEAAMLRAAETVILFEHQRPDGTECNTVNVSKMNGENIGYAAGYSNALDIIHNGLMNSQGHRENILRSSFKSVGIGYITLSVPRYGTATYVAQCFGVDSANTLNKPSNTPQTYIINADESFVLRSGGNFDNVTKYETSDNATEAVSGTSELQRATNLLNKGYAIRLYDSKGKSGDHVYTTDLNEIKNLINKGWIHETENNGSNTFKTSSQKTSEYSVPVYCVTHSSGFHLYTLQESEKNYLAKNGWKSVNGGNPLFYCSGSKGEGIYRAFNPKNSVAPQQHFCRYKEYQYLLANGWSGNNNNKPYWYSN